MLDFISNNILRNPSMLIGLIAAFGLVLQKKKASDVIKGSLLAAFGIIIMETGTGMLVSSIAPINGAFQSISGNKRFK